MASDEDYLPEVYVDFTERYPEVAAAQGELARVIREGSPLDERTQRLVKLGLAVGAEAEGAVRAGVRKALAVGCTPEEVRAVSLQAITTCGFPTAVAGLRWTEQVLRAEQPG